MIDKPAQVSRNDQMSSSSQGKSHNEPPGISGASPAKKKEGMSAPSEGVKNISFLTFPVQGLDLFIKFGGGLLTKMTKP